MLLSNNGELFRKFNKDPVKYLRLIVNSDDIDDEIVQQISDRYFALDKPFHPAQVSKLAEVGELIFSHFSHLNNRYLMRFQIFSDYAFFQDLDESVELFSKYNDEATYYYMYNHTSQFTLQRFLGVSSSLDLSKNIFIFTN